MNKKLNAKDFIMNLNLPCFITNNRSKFGNTTIDCNLINLMEEYANYKNDIISENDGIKYYIVFTNNKLININTNLPIQTRLVVNKSVVNFIESICDCYYKIPLEKWYKLNNLEFQIIPYI